MTNLDYLEGKNENERKRIKAEYDREKESGTNFSKRIDSLKNSLSSNNLKQEDEEKLKKELEKFEYFKSIYNKDFLLNGVLKLDKKLKPLNKK